MSKKLTKQPKYDLPYWPSKEFVEQASAQLREKGIEATDATLSDMVHQAYWKTRAKLLADAKMKDYEDA